MAAVRNGLLGLGAAALLAGCAMSDEKLGALVADPMQYEFYGCPQLANTEKSLKTRLDELDGLMAKASAGAGGGVVNALAYRPEYVNVTGQLQGVHRMQAQKNCSPADAPAQSAVVVPAKPAPAKPIR